MKIIETEKFKKLAQYGPMYHDPVELEGPEKDIATDEEQKEINYQFIKAQVGMNLAHFAHFPPERVDQIVRDFGEDLMRLVEKGTIGMDVAKKHISQAEALIDKPVHLMGWFKHNSPVPGSHTEFMRQKSDLDSLIEHRNYRKVM